MPISSSAARLARERVLAELRSAVDTIKARYGVSLVELALALGVYAPPPGKSGSTLVSSWLAGRRKIDAYDRETIDMLAEGALVLVQIGADAGRKVYRVVPADEALAA